MGHGVIPEIEFDEVTVTEPLATGCGSSVTCHLELERSVAAKEKAPCFSTGLEFVRL